VQVPAASIAKATLVLTGSLITVSRRIANVGAVTAG